MNETVHFLENRLSPQLATAAGLIVIFYFAILGAVKLFEIWRSLRARRAVLEEEKLFHEIAKLRYEIEALRKQHQLADLYPNRPEGSHLHNIQKEDPAVGAIGVEDRGFVGARIRAVLPEVPQLSLSPLLAALRLSFNKPLPGFPRMAWLIKWLAALLFVLVAGAGAILELMSPQIGETALVFLVVLAMLIGVYFAAAILYNGLIGAMAFILFKLRKTNSYGKSRD